MTAVDGSADYWVGDWQVRVDRHELWRDGQARRVQPRLIAVLGCLARAGGRTVSRDELLAGVWQRRMVNDEVLSRAIADLRRALEDDARQPALIETVPKLGYRLCVPVRPVVEATGGVVDADTAGSMEEAPAAAAKRRAGHWPVSATVALAGILLLSGVITWWPAAPPPADAPALSPADLVHARPLAGDGRRNLTPRFSRRGGLYAFSAVAADGETATIQIRSRDGRVRSGLANAGEWDTCPLFSDDGSDLIWTRLDAGRCRLMRVPIAGGVQQELARCAADVLSCPDLSADGERLLYSAAAWTGLAELHLPTGAVREVTRIDAGRSTDADPRYAPDAQGQRIAFLRGRSSDRQPMLLDPALPGGAQVLDFPPARVYGLSWLDAGHIVLATDSEGMRALVAVALDSGARTLLGAPGARRPDRAGDGALIWEVARYQAHLWRLGADDGEVEMTTHRRSDGHPVLSPDGRRLAFQSNREGPDSVWLLDLASGEQQRLPLPTDTMWLYPAWLPQGEGLLLVGQAGGRSTAWRYRFGSAAPEPIDGIGDGVHEVQAAADGTLWFLRDDGQDRRRLWRLPVAAASAVAAVDGAVAAFRPHRDGMYFQRPESDVLWRCAADGSGCGDTGLRLGSLLPGAWALSDTALFHQQAQPGDGVRIMRRDLHAGTDDQATPWTMPSLLPRALAVSADGRIAYVARAALGEVELAWLPPPQARLR